MAKKTEAAMTARVREMIQTTPFIPFDIKTVDGDTFHVFHPDFIMISPSGQSAHHYDKNDHFRIVNLHQVVSIEPTRQKRGSLGSPGKR